MYLLVFHHTDTNTKVFYLTLDLSINNKHKIDSKKRGVKRDGTGTGRSISNPSLNTNLHHPLLSDIDTLLNESSTDKIREYQTCARVVYHTCSSTSDSVQVKSTL